jgi:hypothetical protein
MNTIDFERLKEKEDAAIKSLIAGRESFNPSSTGSFTLSVFESAISIPRLEKESKKDA